MSCHPDTIGNFSILVTATDQAGYSTNRSTNLLVNLPPAIASFNATPATIDIGQTTSLAVNASGGTGLLVFSYGGLPKGCQGTNFSFVNCAPTVAGSFNVGVVVTDAVNGSASAHTNLTVALAPTVTAFGAVPARIDVGQPVTINATVSGGSGTLNYSYVGLPAGCPQTNAGTITCTPTATGVFSLHVTVRDGAGRSAASTGQLVVNLDPAVRSFDVTPAIIDPGTSVTFTAILGGGTGPMTFNYTGLPTGCASANQSTLTCAPTSSGTFRVTVNVRDAVDYLASGETNLTVNQTAPPPKTSGSGSGLLIEEVGLLVAVLAAVAIIAAIVLRRRGGGSSAPPPDEETTDGEEIYGQEPAATEGEVDAPDVPPEAGPTSDSESG